MPETQLVQVRSTQTYPCLSRSVDNLLPQYVRIRLIHVFFLPFGPSPILQILFGRCRSLNVTATFQNLSWDYAQLC